MSKNLNSFLDKLKLENNKHTKYKVLEEQESKDLAKEDALTLIAEFVKDVKKKFENKDDRIEILNDALKTLEFYINEIQNTTEKKAFPADSFNSESPVKLDIDTNEEEF